MLAGGVRCVRGLSVRGVLGVWILGAIVVWGLRRVRAQYGWWWLQLLEVVLSLAIFAIVTWWIWLRLRRKALTHNRKRPTQ